MLRGLPAKIWLVAALAPAFLPVTALAQVNIDAGKSTAEIYASDCATCHKTPRGLAAGKNSLMLSSFLREHYTASGAEASALAAYVLGAGGAEPAPKQKSDTEHARAEEPKTGESRTGEARTGEAKTEPKTAEAKPEQPKTAAHPIRAAVKPEDRRAEDKRAEDKRAKDEAATQEQHLASPAREEHAPETASREASRAPEDAAPVAREPAPASAVAVPREASHETPATAVGASAPPSGPSTATASAAEVRRSDLPSLELGSSLNAKPPAEDQPSAAATVPRDNIPD